MHNNPKENSGRESGTNKGISRRYKGHWLQGYVRGKLRNDPVYAAVAAIISAFPAPVLDIGCGPGLLAHYLNACGVDVPYRGLDTDARKIASAGASAREFGHIYFDAADCLFLPAWQGHVAVLDVLHYLDAEKQARLLREAIPRVTPGASLIIRTVLRDRSWRFRTTQLEETFIRGTRWIKGGAKYYPRMDELVRPMEQAGLAITVTPLFGHTPFNSYLLLGTRPRKADCPT